MDKENGEDVEKVLDSFRQFVRDIIPIAIRMIGVKVEPPTVDVVLIPDAYWQIVRGGIPHADQVADWQSVKAIAAYVPLSFEERLRAFHALQETSPGWQFTDGKLDYSGVIILHCCPTPLPTSGDEDRAVMELFAALASACFPLLTAQSMRCFAIAPITRPLEDENAVAAIHTLTAKMTPAQFAQRYSP